MKPQFTRDVFTIPLDEDIFDFSFATADRNAAPPAGLPEPAQDRGAFPGLPDVLHDSAAVGHNPLIAPQEGEPPEADGQSAGRGRGVSSDDGLEPQAAASWKDGSTTGRGGSNGGGKGKDKTTDGTDGSGGTDSGGTTGGTDSGGGTGTGGTTTPSGNDASEAAPQYAIDALLSGYSYGGNATIAYSFLDALPPYYYSGSQEGSNFSAFNLAQETAVRGILDQLSTLTNVTFVETSDAEAQMTFANTSLPSGYLAWSYFPATTSTYSKASDVWINSDYAHNLSPDAGNTAYKTLLHEIGHALGLKHPHEGTATLPYDENNRQFTVESYYAHPTMPGVEPETYMPYDIAALQYLYGANATTAAGDDVYSFAGADSLIETIWDAGGIDTFDASSRTESALIDLQSGHFSSIGTLGSGAPASNNIAIAYNVTIENAIGGTGDDSIVGNAAANVLNGGGGSDILAGGGGADYFVFDAGWGNDRIADFEDGIDFIDFRSLGITMGDISIAADAGGARVSFGANALLLDHVAVDQVDAQDFLFA